MAYDGPPKYADVPLHGMTEAELAQGEGASDPESFEVGHDQQEEMQPNCDSGTEGLRPFPTVPDEPPEVVEPEPPRYPNPKVQQRGMRVFSEWGDRTGGTTGDQLRVETPEQWNPYRMVRSPRVPDGSSRLWMIDIWAYERIRFPTAAQGPVGPLGGEGTIMESGGAARATLPGNQSSKLKARIMWWASSGGTTRIVDIGQGIRMALEASLVTVEILFPNPGTVQIKQQTTQPSLALNGGTVLDSEVGCSIVPTESTPGVQATTNTIVTSILERVADVPVFIPPGSREVTIYQSAIGDVVTPIWRHGREVAAIGPDVGVIVLDTTRRVVRLPRPGNAGLISTGAADADTDRIVTFVFGLEI